MVPVVGFSKTKLVIGRGRLFFNPFTDGSRNPVGERYLGNTPAFNITRSVETVKPVRSVGGRKIQAEPYIVSENFTGAFTTDNISASNVAYWFGARVEEKLLQGRKVTLNIVAKHGEVYRFSNIEDTADFSSQILDMEIYVLGRRVSLDENVNTSELKYGRFTFAESAPDVFDGDLVTVVATSKQSYEIDIVSVKSSITGSLRYMSHNVSGDDQEYLYPLVTLTCSGLLDLKSDDFQQLTFNVDIFKASLDVPFQYLRIIPKLSLNERAIVDNDISLADFPLMEDLLNRAVQIELPETFNPISFYSFLFPQYPDLDAASRDLGLDRLVQIDIPQAVDYHRTLSWVYPSKDT